MKLKDYLIKIDACTPAIEWVGDRTIEQAIADCHRGDWMLWLAKELNINKRKLVLTAGHCVNSVRNLMIDEHSTYAVDTAIAYGEERITEDELEAAARAACTVYYSAPFCHSAASAAATTYGGFYGSYSAAVHHAAEAAFHAAIDAESAITAKSANQKQTADICRKYIGDLIIQHFNNLTK